MTLPVSACSLLFLGCPRLQYVGGGSDASGSAYVLMLQVLEQLELSVRSLGQDRCAKRFHNLLDRHRLAGELILGRATQAIRLALWHFSYSLLHSPYEPKGTHANRLQICIPIRRISATQNLWLMFRLPAYLLVISKVVPKIWARTNSAILPVLLCDRCRRVSVEGL